MGPIGNPKTSVRMSCYRRTFPSYPRSPWPLAAFTWTKFFPFLAFLMTRSLDARPLLHRSSKFSSRLAALRGRCRGYWGIFGVTPDTTILGFPSGTFLFICAYIYWCKRLNTEWVLGLCNWITNYFSKEHQFTVDGYLIFWCVFLCALLGAQASTV